MPTACRGTEKRKGGDKKARQWRANVASLHKVLDTQTGWWAREDSNLQPDRYERQEASQSRQKQRVFNDFHAESQVLVTVVSGAKRVR
jgi:hypothetical protein